MNRSVFEDWNRGSTGYFNRWSSGYKTMHFITDFYFLYWLNMMVGQWIVWPIALVCLHLNLLIGGELVDQMFIMTVHLFFSCFVNLSVWVFHWIGWWVFQSFGLFVGMSMWWTHTISLHGNEISYHNFAFIPVDPLCSLFVFLYTLYIKLFSRFAIISLIHCDFQFSIFDLLTSKVKHNILEYFRTSRAEAHNLPALYLIIYFLTIKV